MPILFYASVAFVLSFFIHLVIWKIHLPKTNHTVLLLGIFFLVLAVIIAVAIAIKDLLPSSIYKLESLFDYLDLLTLYTSLTLAYIVTYSAIEVDSPSLVIVLHIAKSGPKGLDRLALSSIMNNDNLVLPRIKDLVDDKMAYLDNGIYRLTPKGIFWANIFIFFRRVLNVPMGG